LSIHNTTAAWNGFGRAADDDYTISGTVAVTLLLDSAKTHH
jgi:hypothetical protein